MIRRLTPPLALAIALSALACAPTHAPPIRFVTASPAELTLADDQKEVWYEVQEGDELPLVFLFSGVAQGMSDVPVVLKAQKTFFLVYRGDGGFHFSFDGKTVAANAGRVALTLIPGPPANRAGLILYIGRPEDMETALKSLKEASDSAGAESAPPESEPATGASEAAEP